MSCLADLAEIVGFFSYAREDDESFEGRLSALRSSIQHELGAQLGRTRAAFRLWQDKEAIPAGRLWEEEIKTAVAQSVFFIPIVTPRAVNSQYCRFEFDAFLARERELGRADLVFPILYVPVPALLDEARWRGHPVLAAIAARQFVDWQMFRHADVPTPEMRLEIAKFCQTIVEAIQSHWISPEERELQEQAARERRAEEERQLREAEARRLAEEEAQRHAREAAEKLRAEEAAARRRLEEEEARQRAAAEAAVFAAREAAVEIEHAFEQARRTDTVAAVDAFMASHPESPLADEARKLRETLVARQSAYEAANMAGDKAALEAFLADYPDGLPAREVRERLDDMLLGEAYLDAMASDDPALLRSFLDHYPESDEAPDARARLDAIACEEAYRRAMASTEAAPIEDFLKAYAGDPRAGEVRARLGEIEPPSTQRRNALIGGAVAVIAGAAAIALARFDRPAAPRPTTIPRGLFDPATAPPARPRPSVPRLASALTLQPTADTATFDSTGNWILTSTSHSDPATVGLWNARTGEAVIKITQGSRFVPLSNSIEAQLNSNGKRILTMIQGGDVKLWNAASGREIATLQEPANIFSLGFARFLSGGRHVITSRTGSSAALISDAETGKTLATLSGHSAAIRGIDATADGLNFLTASADKTAKLWTYYPPSATLPLSSPLDTPRLRLTLSGHEAAVTAAQFSPNGAMIATRSDDSTVRIWDSVSGAPGRILKGQFAEAKLNKDGSRIATASSDGSASLWAIYGTERLTTFEREPYSPLEFSPDGALLMVSTKASCRIVNTYNGAPVTDLPRPLRAAAFSPESGRILGASKDDNDASLWDARTGATQAVLQGSGVSRVAFSPDGRRAVTVSTAGTVSVYDLPDFRRPVVNLPR